MTTKKVVIGSMTEEVSEQLLAMLGFTLYTNSDTAHPESRPTAKLAEAVAAGLHGDEAAIWAIAKQEQRRAEQTIETARQRVAELAAAAAEDHAKAEGLAYAREKLAEKRRSAGY